MDSSFCKPRHFFFTEVLTRSRRPRSRRVRTAPKAEIYVNMEGKSSLETLAIHFDMRARLVGVNQILDTDMPHLGMEANDLFPFL